MSKSNKGSLTALTVPAKGALSAAVNIPRIDRALFDKAQGETFAGLNLVKIEVGAADGPFKFAGLTPPRYLNDKYNTPIQTALAVRCDEKGNDDGLEIGLPASASMTQKVFDARLAVGDIFAIAREANYKSKKGREDCHAYIVKVFHRSGQAAVKPATDAEISQVMEAAAKEAGGQKAKAIRAAMPKKD